MSNFNNPQKSKEGQSSSPQKNPSQNPKNPLQGQPKQGKDKKQKHY